MKKIIFISLIVILVLPNIPIIGTQILRIIDGNYFRYSNNDASFTSIQNIDIFSPWPSDKSSLKVQSITLDSTVTSENQQIFRLYKINPLYFWRWRYYISVSRLYPYKSWEEIEPNRVPFNSKYIWQKF